MRSGVSDGYNQAMHLAIFVCAAVCCATATARASTSNDHLIPDDGTSLIGGYFDLLKRRLLPAVRREASIILIASGMEEAITLHPQKNGTSVTFMRSLRDLESEASAPHSSPTPASEAEVETLNCDIPPPVAAAVSEAWARMVKDARDYSPNAPATLGGSLYFVFSRNGTLAVLEPGQTGRRTNAMRSMFALLRGYCRVSAQEKAQVTNQIEQEAKAILDSESD